MKALIATWPRRAAVSVAAWMIAAVLMASLMAHVEQPDPTQLEIGDWMKRFVFVPSLAALMVLLFTTATARSAHAAPATEPVTHAVLSAEEVAKPFVAQVAGLIWLNPLQRMDYPTEWQLLWTQGLVSPNKNDDMVRTDPKSFTTLQSIGALVYGNEGAETFRGFYRKYMTKFRCCFAHAMQATRNTSTRSSLMTRKAGANWPASASSLRFRKDLTRPNRKAICGTPFERRFRSAIRIFQPCGAETRFPMSRSRKAGRTPASPR